MEIDIEKQKAALEEDLARVTAELKTLGIHNPDVPSDWIATPSDAVRSEPDPNDAADRVEDWDERRATLAVLETRYNNVTRALKNIADGTYGMCEIGNEPIEPARLEAYPAARTCSAHADSEPTET